MRIFIAISLIFSFCFLSMRSALVFSYFKMNQEYITANFCVDRMAKKSTCKGSCRLKDMMEITEQSDQPRSIPIIPNLQAESFFPSLEKDENLTIQLLAFFNENNFSYPLLIDRLSVNRLIQPPDLFTFPV